MEKKTKKYDVESIETVLDDLKFVMRENDMQSINESFQHFDHFVHLANLSNFNEVKQCFELAKASEMNAGTIRNVFSFLMGMSFYKAKEMRDETKYPNVAVGFFETEFGESYYRACDYIAYFTAVCTYPRLILMQRSGNAVRVYNKYKAKIDVRRGE